jgi:hypothetical protein
MNPRAAGPFEVFTTQSVTAPWYLIPYDKEGNCEGPQTLQHFIDAARAGNFTDVHIFSHGWNNVFTEAVGLYREFWTEYFAMRDQLGLNDAATYRPLIAGVIWPSTALVSDEEQTPAIAGTDNADIEELASDLPADDAQRLREISSAGREITREEALEVARILLPIYNRPEPDDFAAADGDAGAATPEELVDLWLKAQTASRPRFADLSGEPGILPPISADPLAVPPLAMPAPAGILDFLDPKNIIRTATVYQMKDRAGRVGANGVGAMLNDLLASTALPVHLVGHSYGGRVVLSALCGREHPRKVRSMLLLQPAVN